MKKNSKITTLAVKAMGIFGGVQMFGILCAFVRSKLVALWIGPAGVGLFAIFNQALEMLNTGTNLGIRQSSVRDISLAVEQDDKSLRQRIIAVVRRWSLWLALGGTLVTMALSPLLSRYTFGDYDHVWHYVALSVAVLLMAITNGEYAVLQGVGKLRRLAKVMLSGNIGGLLISIPLFYRLREQSILPSIIAYAACCTIAAIVVRDKPQPVADLTRRDTLREGAQFVRLGIYMTLGTFVTMLMTYVFTAWLNAVAGIAEVGLYQAGNVLVNKYTGLVFTALGMEFYPRLAKVADSRRRLRVFVSQEVNVALLVLAPVLAVFLLLRDPVIILFYTEEFLPVSSMVAWSIGGTLFRAVSWCLAFVILARGDGRLFLLTETLSALTSLALNILFYTHWGLEGLGIAYDVWYIIYTVIVAVVYFGYYRLTLGRSCLYALLWTVAITVAVTAVSLSGVTAVAIILAVVSAVPTVYYLWRFVFRV